MAGSRILLLGSGFVAAPCVEYLCRKPENIITIASKTLENAQALSSRFPGTTAVSCDISNKDAIEAIFADNDVIISLIPYIYHTMVIKAAVKLKKHVVTTSYISPAIFDYDQEAKDSGVIVMNEIGLDPGIDHIYAVKIIDDVHKEGGKIKEFISYCGGLPAPESSNNPFGYKFSWSARGVLTALKSTAKHLEKGKVIEASGAALMESVRKLNTGYPGFAFVGYDNRDSTVFAERYKIPEAETIIRGNIRYDGYCQIVKVLLNLGFLNDEEDPLFASDAVNITWSEVLRKLLGVQSPVHTLENAVIEKCGLQDDDYKDEILDGMRWLGLFSDTAVLRRGTLLDTFCATL